MLIGCLNRVFDRVFDRVVFTCNRCNPARDMSMRLIDR